MWAAAALGTQHAVGLKPGGNDQVARARHRDGPPVVQIPIRRARTVQAPSRGRGSLRQTRAHGVGPHAAEARPPRGLRSTGRPRTRTDTQADRPGRSSPIRNGSSSPRVFDIQADQAGRSQFGHLRQRESRVGPPGESFQGAVGAGAPTPKKVQGGLAGPSCCRVWPAPVLARVPGP
ncbi:hypothetical protein NDU88_006547 [Pleurodeles waltl]|uniref:Uncharacterized protein n=1 Tax=Pleurodeles waltl TaxID=8319 RepID=A0AAV7SPW6_PLEWA|nr:hypothetical protein NDU88_006547 [Pleurodeles waltl]